MTYSKKPEETLDPENWDQVRKLGHRIVDEILFKTIENENVGNQ
jgi:hypothetical protein